jgi:hypothetical protein
MYQDQFRTTFQRKAVPGMLIGYEDGSKAYRILLPGRRIRVSRDVVFVEEELGAPIVGMMMREKNTGRFPEHPSPNQWQREHCHTDTPCDFLNVQESSRHTPFTADAGHSMQTDDNNSESESEDDDTDHRTHTISSGQGSVRNRGSI